MTYNESDTPNTINAPAAPLSRREWLGWLGAFSLATAAFCASVIISPFDHLGGEPLGDRGTNLWNLWWVYYAVFERVQSPLWCDMVFAPWGVDLRFHTLSLGNGLLASPLTALAGPVFACNALFLLWTALTGVFAAAWARGHGAGLAPAGLAGFIAAFGPYRFNHLEHLNLFSTAPLFLSFYSCDRMFESNSKTRSLLFALSWAFTALVDWYYAIFAGIYWVLRFGLHLYMEPDRSKTLLSPSLYLPVFSMAVLVYLYFIAGASSRPAIQPDDMPLSVAAFWSLDLIHLVAPIWSLNNLPWADIEAGSEFLLNPGLIVLMFGAIGIFSRNAALKHKRFLGFVALTFFLISLGPVLKCAGAPVAIAGIPLYLPTAIYSFVPVLDSMRVFTRFSYIGFVVLALFAGIAINGFFLTLRFRWAYICVWALALGVIITEIGYSPPNMTHYIPSPLFAEIENGPVQEFPLGSKEFGFFAYHQTIHRQPVCLAEFSRLGSYQKAYLNAFPVFNAIPDNREPEYRQRIQALFEHSGDAFPFRVMIRYQYPDLVSDSQKWGDDGNVLIYHELPASAPMSRYFDFVIE